MRGRLAVQAAAVQVGTVLMQAVERVDETRLVRVRVRVRVGVSRQKPDRTALVHERVTGWLGRWRQVTAGATVESRDEESRYLVRAAHPNPEPRSNSNPNSNQPPCKRGQPR
jgi:hypothetical protein